ncbi:hypothetical protein D3C81_875110 [compost metagenome]
MRTGETLPRFQHFLAFGERRPPELIFTGPAAGHMRQADGRLGRGGPVRRHDLIDPNGNVLLIDDRYRTFDQIVFLDNPVAQLHPQTVILVVQPNNQIVRRQAAPDFIPFISQPQIANAVLEFHLQAGLCI